MWHVLGSRDACRTLVEKPEEKIQLKDMGVGGNIMLMYFKEIGLEDVDWFALAQDREKWRGIGNT